MLKKKYRLTQGVKIKGNKFSSNFFSLKYFKNDKKNSRFGFVISKKIDKSSTTRNKIKRQFRYCVEENLVKIKTGIDLLFIVKKEVVGKTTKEICSSIENAFKKEDLLIK